MSAAGSKSPINRFYIITIFLHHCILVTARLVYVGYLTNDSYYHILFVSE